MIYGWYCVRGVYVLCDVAHKLCMMRVYAFCVFVWCVVRCVCCVLTVQLCVRLMYIVCVFGIMRIMRTFLWCFALCVIVCVCVLYYCV